MCVLYVVGRVLFASIFIVAAPRHFTAEGIGPAAERRAVRGPRGYAVRAHGAGRGLQRGKRV